MGCCFCQFSQDNTVASKSTWIKDANQILERIRGYSERANCPKLDVFKHQSLNEDGSTAEGAVADDNASERRVVEGGDGDTFRRVHLTADDDTTISEINSFVSRLDSNIDSILSPYSLTNSKRTLVPWDLALYFSITLDSFFIHEKILSRFFSVATWITKDETTPGTAARLKDAGLRPGASIKEIDNLVNTHLNRGKKLLAIASLVKNFAILFYFPHNCSATTWSRHIPATVGSKTFQDILHTLEKLKIVEMSVPSQDLGLRLLNAVLSQLGANDLRFCFPNSEANEISTQFTPLESSVVPKIQKEPSFRVWKRSQTDGKGKKTLPHTKGAKGSVMAATRRRQDILADDVGIHASKGDNTIQSNNHESGDSPTEVIDICAKLTQPSNNESGNQNAAVRTLRIDNLIH